MDHMSCNRGLIQAFARVLDGHPLVSDQTLAWLRKRSQLKRVGVAQSYQAIAKWVQETRDEDLGLRAGALVQFGEGGALDFAMRSAATLRCSLDVATRHARLWSDALEPKLVLGRRRALVRLDTKLPWPRAAADFIVSAWHINHIGVHLPARAQVEVWFAHSRPTSTAEYERVFREARLQFDAPCYGIVFDRALVDLPQPSCDPALHVAHCQHLEFMQARLSQQLSFAAQVREWIAIEMRTAKPTSRSIAHRMHISRRTLVRRLRKEGASFSSELDQVRHRLARDLIVEPELTLIEISSLLRFSHVQSLHRAFRRWTDQTPTQFRSQAFDEPGVSESTEASFLASIPGHAAASGVDQKNYMVAKGPP